MSFHKKCFKKSSKLKHNNSIINSNNNNTINQHNHNHNKFHLDSNLHRNESITIEQNSLISLCSPFIIPSNTKHHSYILQKDNFNHSNSKISLSVIYGDIDEPPNLTSTNSSHYSHINKNNHLNTLLSTILLLDEIDNNKLYYTAINNDISIDDMNTDNILLSDNSYFNLTFESDSNYDSNSDSDSDSDLDSDSDSELDLESDHLNISSISVAAGSTILQDRIYEKTVLDIDNDFNTDFANILSEIDVQIAST